MFRIGITALAMAAMALAEAFTFTIGSPVASQDFEQKCPHLCSARKAVPIPQSHKSAAPPKDL